MKERHLLFSLAFFLSLFPLGKLHAQSAGLSPLQVNPDYLKMPEAERVRALKDFKLKYPLLAQRKSLIPRKTDFPEASRGTITVPSKSNGSARLLSNSTSDVTLWANLGNCDDWSQFDFKYGYYSFKPENPVSLSFLYGAYSKDIARNGVQYTDGHIYGMYIDFAYAIYGYIYQFLYDTDLSTGQTNMTTLNSSTDMELAGVETAQADDGTVYGEFYNSNASAYNWGTVDYATRTHTVIAPATNTYVALGITKEGQLYGVATDGNLYKIDRSNGTETLVGPTGLTLTAADGSHYAQSGEIDQTDNTFYWAAVDANGNCGIYTVNLETGAATKIADEKYQLYGMMIAPKPIADGVPAKVTDAALNFEGTSLNGTLTFKAPTQKYGGDTLTGSLTYTVKQDDKVVASGNANAGDQVSVDLSVPASGNYKFVVTTSNEEGESPNVVLQKWIGFDVPLPVTNVTATNNNGKVTVAWTAPVKGIHDGALGDLTYDVYRIVNGDSVKIADNTDATSVVDDLTDSPLGSYAYAVKAKANGLESEFATSEGIAVGSSIEPDWTDDISDANDFSLYTALDANKDGITWTYGTQFAKGPDNIYAANDDWLFTPALHLAPGYLYKVTFKVRNAARSPYNNDVEVKWGNDTTAEAMTNTLLETESPGFDWETKTYEINVPTDGKYYIGFHDNTPERNKMYIYVDSISVVKSKGTFGTAPLSVTNLTLTPAERGDLQATLNFNVPTKSVSNSNIDKVDSIQIERDGEVIATLKDQTAGAAITYADNTITADGFHTYVVTPYLNGNFGKHATVTAFVGKDSPEAPKNVELKDNIDNILAMWDSFDDKGPNGGYVDPDNVKVSFFTLLASLNGYQLGDSLATSDPGETQTTIAMNPEQTTVSDGKTQTMLQLAARGDYGNHQSAYSFASPLIIGPSIKLPFKESFNEGKIENGLAWIEGNAQFNSNSTAASWQLSKDYSADADGGSAMWHDYSVLTMYGPVEYTITYGDEVSINGPKITLSGAANPKLYFKLFAKAHELAKLKVQAQTPDGVSHDLETFDLSTSTQDGWTTKSIDLSQFASERYIMLRFWGIADADDIELGIDNINVIDQVDHSIAALGIHAPHNVKAGKTAKADVYVENFGAQPANGYSVVLFADNEPVDTVTINKDLNTIDKDTVEMSFPVAVNRSGNINLKAEVFYDPDMDNSDNSTETTTVKVVPSEYVKVNTLDATADDSGVTLNWKAPVNPDPVEVIEDFENYEPFVTEFGDWTVYDGDGGLTSPYFSSYSYPGEGTEMAFDIFNPNAITSDFNVVENNPGMAPHSGDQYAAAPYARDKNGYYLDHADNWLISPELPGKKQTISFYALNVSTMRRQYNETFEVLYSTTDNYYSSFTKLENDTANGSTLLNRGANWKYFTVDLPEGAKYFAIRNTTSGMNSFLFGIDDVTFLRVAPGTNDTIIGFNIYRDGELVGNVKGDAVTFNDNNATAGQHVYNVTVLYQDANGNVNESGFSNDATVNVVTGISSITANENGTYDVYTIDGKAVRLNAKSLDGLKPGVYVINDCKYVIK